MDISSKKEFDLYKDIQNRTDGEVYLGIVGPVRTGKSTFIKRFMDLMVLPYMEDVHSRQRTIDELPQSAQGKTIMTTEPKFIPKDAAEIALEDDTRIKIRLIDCVGFMVDGATGHMEGSTDRMVHTPWFDHEIPFVEAASIGTEKVIRDHATIGIVVTTDGSIGDLPRENYVNAEEQTVQELEEIGKPYVVVLNSTRPYSEETVRIAEGLREKYQTAVLPVNCEQLRKDDVFHILDGNAPARSSDEGGNHTGRQNDPRWNAKSERYLCTGFYAGALCLADEIGGSGSRIWLRQNPHGGR